MVMVDREPQPTDGPDYHADHVAWEHRQRQAKSKKFPPLHPDQVAQDRTAVLTVSIHTFGNLDQVRQVGARAVKILAVSFQSHLTGTLEDGTTFQFLGNGNPYEPEEEGQEADQPS